MTTRMISLVSAKLDARLELELSAVQAELQAEAERYRAMAGETPAGISKRLEALAIQLGEPSPMDAPVLAPPPKKTVKKLREESSSVAAKPKKRGRPPKSPQPQLTFEPKETQP
ncbi:MAG: hypothetical protein DCC67_03640 [Planctomycetota bacterium]|nr:MAG: hypothetical protein DCC67_03640 [Planctomycetota bacterium]